MLRVKTPQLGKFKLAVLVMAVASLFAGALSISPIQQLSPAYSSVACPAGWTSASAEICELKVLSDGDVTLPSLISTYDVLLVGGGGGGGGAGGNPNGGNAGGGGGGEVKYLAAQNLSGVLTVDVGAGGAGGPKVSNTDTGVSTPPTPGSDGSPTVLSGALASTALGGGGGQQGSFNLGDNRTLSELNSLQLGRGGNSGNGNSGGLAGWNTSFGQAGFLGSATEYGGGGAGDGENAPVSTSSSNGGAGSLPNSGLFSDNTTVYFGGGGGAGGNFSRLGGSGGGGKGGIYNESAIAGTANTGGGGGGAGGSRNSSFLNGGGVGANGGSGIVILRFQIPAAPGNPISPAANAGDGTATVSWTAPTPDTAPINYTVTASPNSPAGLTCSVSNLTAVCSPLTNGQEYTFTITATNYSGTSSATVAATPFAPPRPEPQPTVTPTPSPPPTPSEDDFDVDGEDGELNVEVDLPSPSASSPERYEVTVKPSGKSCIITIPAETCSIDGLKNRTPYKVEIKAINSSGGNSITLGRKYMFISGKLLVQTSQLRVNGFTSYSSEVSSRAEKAILGFVDDNKSGTAFTCVGYAAGKKANPGSRSLAIKRANEVCSVIKAEKSSVVALRSGKVPGSKEIPRNRKVVVTAYAPVF